MLGQAQILCTVVQAEENPVGDPVPAAEDPGHSPQQDSTEGQFLAEDVVEEHACQRQTENPPLTLEPWIGQALGTRIGRLAQGRAVQGTYLDLAVNAVLRTRSNGERG
jgi:hypothetical protein